MKKTKQIAYFKELEKQITELLSSIRDFPKASLSDYPDPEAISKAATFLERSSTSLDVAKYFIEKLNKKYEELIDTLSVDEKYFLEILNKKYEA